MFNCKIFDLAIKKAGSGFHQDDFSLAKQHLINKMVDKIDGNLCEELVTDYYGNYFCSELISHKQVNYLE